MGDTVPFKYRAFLSYSHRDQSWGKWLHSHLERFSIDKDLVGRPTSVGPIPKSLGPIFRDRDDFAAGHSLTERTVAALNASQFLIVLCSQTASKSRYVNEEIRRFKLIHSPEHILPVIIDGEPGNPSHECFPPALRFKVGADGNVTDVPEELIAADLRPQQDGKDLAKQKVIAGLLGIGLDEIVRRAERARRRRNRLWSALAASFLLLAVLATGSAVYAYQKLIESEQRLDQAIEIAYGFVTEATNMSDRFGVPSDVTLNLLRRAESALNELISKGAHSRALEFRKASMLISFADSYFNIGKTDDALERSIDAANLLRSLVASNPRNVEWRAALFGVTVQEGNLFSAKRQIAEALKSYQESIALGNAILKENLGSAETVMRIAQAHISIGDLLIDTSATEAEQNYRGALDDVVNFANVKGGGDVFTKLPAALGMQPHLQLVAFQATDRLISLMANQGHLKIALNYNRAMYVYHEALTIQSSQSIALQEGLLNSALQFANSLLDTGNVDEAQNIFQSGLSLSERLAASDPSNIIYKRLVALLQDGVGRTLLASGKTDDALVTFRSNLQAGIKFIAADPGNFLWQGILGVGYERVGDALVLKGDFAEALKNFELENVTVTKVSKASPEDDGWRVRLAITQFKMAEALLGEGDRSKAEGELSASLDFWDKKVASNTTLVFYRAFQEAVLWRLAELHNDTTQLDQAWSTLRQLNADDALGYEARRWLSNAERQALQKGLVLPEVTTFPSCDHPEGFSSPACDQSDREKSTGLLALAYRIPCEVYRLKGDFEKAAIDYTEAISDDPNSPASYNARALAYQGLGEFDKSIIDLNEAIRLDPDFAIAFSNRGFAYANTHQLDRAIRDYSESVRLDPDNPTTRSLRGDAYRLSSQFKQAIADYDQALARDPNNAATHNVRALAYQQLGQFDKSMADLDTAIRIDPNFSIAYSNRGFAYANMREIDRAISDYGSAISLESKNALTHSLRGDAYRQKSEFDLALADYDQSIAIAPNNPAFYNNRALAFQGKNQFEESIVDLDKAIALNPQYAIAFFNRGSAYISESKFDVAISDISKAILLNPQMAIFYNLRGVAYFRNNDLDQAFADFTRAIKIDPKYATAYSNCGKVYEARGQLELALEEYEKALELVPSLQPAIEGRARVSALH